MMQVDGIDLYDMRLSEDLISTFMRVKRKAVIKATSSINRSMYPVIVLWWLFKATTLNTRVIDRSFLCCTLLEEFGCVITLEALALSGRASVDDVHLCRINLVLHILLYRSTTIVFYGYDQ